MNATNPTISVVIPLFNKERTVKRALDSVMRQTVLPMEIIVVDDGSTDESRDVVEQSRHPLVTLICQKNAGVSAARNIGIREARGEWIAFLDADDEWEPGYLEQINRLILQFPTCIGAATAYYLGDAQGNKIPIRLRNLPFTTESGVLSNYFQVAVHSDPPVWTSAVCIQKNKLLELSGFPSGVIAGEDLLTWARMAIIGNFAYCIKPLSKYWQDNQLFSDSSHLRIPDPIDIVGNELIKIHENVSGCQKKWIFRYIGHWHKMRASVYLGFGMDRLALKEILLSFRYHPARPMKLFVYLIMICLPLQFRRNIFKFYKSIHAKKQSGNNKLSV